jgi:hypothetical protein
MRLSAGFTRLYRRKGFTGAVLSEIAQEISAGILRELQGDIQRMKIPAANTREIRLSPTTV